MTTQTTSAKTATKTKAATPQGAKAAMPKTAAAKSPIKPTTKAVAKPTTPKAKPVKAEKPAKVKKPKLVRDSFTIPKDEYEVIDALKVRGGKLGQAIKKSELLRAGIKALATMSDIQFKAALIKVPTIKTGRPTNAK